MRGLELRLEEHAAIGYRFQRGRPFVRKTEANEELEGDKWSEEKMKQFIFSVTTHLVTKFAGVWFKILGQYKSLNSVYVLKGHTYLASRPKSEHSIP